MSANVNVSRSKRLHTIKKGGNGGRKMQCRSKKTTNEISRLNDFCLLEIFNRLDLKDLLNLTDTNNQFKRVSEMSFAGRYAKFIYRADTWHHEPRRSEMRRVLCKFGKLIKSMSYKDWLSKSVELDAIPKFCAGGNLDELHLSTKTMIKNNGCARLLFSSLKSLTLNYFRFNGRAGALFSECQELKTLRLNGIPTRRGMSCDVIQKYRKLEELYIGNVTVRTTKSLLQLNQQIKKLNIGIYATTFAVVPTMVHLEELILRGMHYMTYDLNNYYNDIAKLTALKSLKVLGLCDVLPEYVTAIVEAMENVHSLDRFECIGFYKDCRITNPIKKLKTLKSLGLIFPNLPLDYLAELDGQFPLLHELKLEFYEHRNDPARSIGNLIRFVELSTTLEVLTIRTQQPQLFNQLFYDELLKVIQRRQSSKTFKVTVYCFQPISMALNVHNNLLQVELNHVKHEDYVMC